MAQSQAGQSRDNQDSQKGARKCNEGFLNTISWGRREEKFGSKWKDLAELSNGQ